MNKKYVFWTIKDLADIATIRRNKEFDCIIAFCGARGNSKSTGAYKIGLQLKFNAEKDIIYDRNSLLQALEDWNRIIDGDEMINSAYKREFYNVEQIELIKLLNMYRDHQHVIIFCIPNFWDLDKALRDLIKIRIDMHKRGFGEVHVPLQMSYISDSWDKKNNEKIERIWVEKRNKRKPWLLSTFAGFIKFGKLAPDQEKKYKRIKNEAREKLREDKEARKKNMESKKELDFYTTTFELLQDNRLTKEGIFALSKMSGKKIFTIRDNLRKMLREKGDNRPLAELILTTISKKDSNSNDSGKLNEDNIQRKSGNTEEEEKIPPPKPLKVLNGY